MPSGPQHDEEPLIINLIEANDDKIQQPIIINVVIAEHDELDCKQQNDENLAWFYALKIKARNQIVDRIKLNNEDFKNN